MVKLNVFQPNLQVKHELHEQQSQLEESEYYHVTFLGCFDPSLMSRTVLSLA